MPKIPFALIFALFLFLKPILTTYSISIPDTYNLNLQCTYQDINNNKENNKKIEDCSWRLITSSSRPIGEIRFQELQEMEKSNKKEIPLLKYVDRKGNVLLRLKVTNGAVGKKEAEVVDQSGYKFYTIVEKQSTFFYNYFKVYNYQNEYRGIVQFAKGFGAIAITIIDSHDYKVARMEGDYKEQKWKIEYFYSTGDEFLDDEMKKYYVFMPVVVSGYYAIMEEKNWNEEN